jgi:hypothetical protein
VYFAATRAVGTGPERGAIVLGMDEDDLHCTVRGADPAPLDLEGIRDRVEAVGGTLQFPADALQLRVPLTSGGEEATSVADARPRG